MYRLEVRCCCIPKNLLGWIDSPINRQGKFQTAVRNNHTIDTLVSEDFIAYPKPVELGCIQVCSFL